MDPEESRNPQSYHLYQNERRYLLKEGSGSRTEGEIRKQIIHEKLPKLPNRIQDLIDDIALLNNRDLLTASNWEDGWVELTKVEYPADLRESDVWLPCTNLTDFNKLGFVLGRFGRTISQDLAPTYDSQEFVWGFLLGAVGRPQGEYRAEQSEIKRILEHLKEKFSARQSAVSAQREATEKEALKADIDYSGIDQSLSSGAGFRDMVEKAKEERRKLRDGEKPVDYEHLELLNDIITASPGEMVAISELSQLVQQSAHQVTEISWRKTPAIDLLQVLHTEDSGLSSLDIASKCDSHEQLVTHLMRWLAGEKDDYEWNYPPLITKNQNTEGIRTWELTPFGKLIAASLFEEGGMETVQREIVKKLVGHSTDREIGESIDQVLSAEKFILNE